MVVKHKTSQSIIKDGDQQRSIFITEREAFTDEKIISHRE